MTSRYSSNPVGAGSVWIEKESVFGVDEVRTMVEFVLEGIDHWSRVQRSPLWSYGVPAYRFVGTRAEYLAQVQPLNRRFRSALGRHFVRILAAIERILGESTKLIHEVAHPGFHILKFDEFPTYDPGDPHCDAPHARVPWRDPGAVDVDGNLTFTVPLALPRESCGLEIFPLWEAATDEEGQSWSTMKPLLQVYEVGSLFLFSGSWRHRLSPVLGSPGETRTTLQGHLARIHGQMVAYW